MDQKPFEELLAELVKKHEDDISTPEEDLQLLEMLEISAKMTSALLDEVKVQQLRQSLQTNS